MPEEDAVEAAVATPAIRLCRSCVGSNAFLSDIEDLCAHVKFLGAPVLGGCLNHCSEGPNCVVNGEVLFRNRTFDKSLEVLEKCLGSTPEISEETLRRVRLKSDAMRLMECGPEQNMKEAEALLTEAIRIELESSVDGGGSTHVWSQGRLAELRTLRANARASPTLGDFIGAVGDLDDVLVERPSSARVYLEKAKIFRRARKPADALQCFSRALELGTDTPSKPTSEKPQNSQSDEGQKHDAPLAEQGKGDLSISPQESAWIKASIEHLKDVIAQGGVGECGSSATDSGDGSGRWKVTKITGTSFDTCIYHLENQPPAVPHPYPGDAWHVSVRFGAASRDYTPISSATDWERGRLDLLVKTYTDGEVSRKFAALQPFTLSQGACWVTVTVPKLTLTLPNLADGLRLQQPSLSSASQVRHIGLVVGGTGVVPALQILREVAKGAEGPFNADCQAVLIYASRRACDVLALDELRAVESSCPGRVVVWHTLTDHREDTSARDTVAQEASASFSKALSSLPCRHRFFASFWKPASVKTGPLRTALGEEAGLRGRPTQAMLAALLPKPCEDVKTVVCGPPQMWEDVRDMLLSIGHAQNSIIELKALSAEQLVNGAAVVAQCDDRKESEPKAAEIADDPDVEARIKAAQAVNEDEDARRSKATVTAKLPSSAEATAAPAKRQSWWSEGWWQDSSWNSWDNSNANAWKSGRWS